MRNISENLYQNQTECPEIPYECRTVRSFFEAFLEKKSNFEESSREIIENYFIVTSFFQDEEVFDHIIFKSPFQPLQAKN